MLLVLFNPQIGPYQVLPRWARVDLKVMAMQGYSAFPKAPTLLEPHHQIGPRSNGNEGVALYSPKPQHYWDLTIRLFSVISKTLVGRDLTPLQRCSWCILQPQPTGQHSLWGGSYPFAEVQSVYSTAPADWAIHRVKCQNSFISDNLV